ncbi:MAG TPA: hypothetical protein VG734_24960 [Lacunisphaera sp.]|nr:hypothetical protein [Lacunisphaera sp.]
MNFRFRVTDTWELAAAGVCHLIGLLEEGSILPNSEAVVDGALPREIFINSVALVNYRDAKPHPNEFTLSVKKPAFELATLKGSVLRNKK